MVKKVKDKKTKYVPVKNDKRIGNKFAERFKTPQERQEAFRLFCNHLGDGYSAKSFHFPCVENTIYNMMKAYPEEFDELLLNMAKAKSAYFWEHLGKLGIAGKIKDFNVAGWIWATKNRLSWVDKTQVQHLADPDAPPPLPAPAPIINNINLSKMKTEDLKKLDEIITRAKSGV